MLKSGDIIFQQVTDTSSLNEAISSCGTNFEENLSGINHVGIYIGNETVIDASSALGVSEKKINDFLCQGQLNVIATICESSLINNAIKRAVSCLGKPYNISFYPDDDGFYCSQLITYSFKYPNGDSYFKLHGMNFLDSKTKILSSYWISYYKKLNKPIPHGLIGSHPQQILAQNNKFKSIKKLPNNKIYLTKKNCYS